MPTCWKEGICCGVGACNGRIGVPPEAPYPVDINSPRPEGIPIAAVTVDNSKHAIPCVDKIDVNSRKAWEKAGPAIMTMSDEPREIRVQLYGR